MKCKFLSQTIFAAAVTVSAVTAIGPPASATELSFSCQTINGVVTTVAETQTGESQNLFYWHSDALYPSENAQEKCQRVSNKLGSAGGNHKFELTKEPGGPELYLKKQNETGQGTFLFSTGDISKMKRIFPNMDRFVPEGTRGVDTFGRPVSIWYLLGF